VFGFAHAFVFLADESDAYSTVTSPFPPILRMLIGNVFQPTLLDGTDDRFFLFPSIVYFFVGPVLLINLLIAMLSESEFTHAGREVMQSAGSPTPNPSHSLPRPAFNKVTEQATSRWTLERARIINSLEADIPAWLWLQGRDESWLVKRCKYWADLDGMQLEVEEVDPKKCVNDDRAAKVAEVYARAKARLDALTAPPPAALTSPPVRAGSATPLLTSAVPASKRLSSLVSPLPGGALAGAAALPSPPVVAPHGGDAESKHAPTDGSAGSRDFDRAAALAGQERGNDGGEALAAIGIVPRGSTYGMPGE